MSVKKNIFNLFWLCLLLPMFVAIAYIYFVADFISLSNWRIIMLSRIFFSIIYAVGLLFLLVQYRKKTKNTIIPLKIKIRNLFGYLCFFMFFYFLSPVNAYRDLLIEPAEYSGGCEIENKFTNVSVEHFLIITKPEVLLRLGSHHYNLLSTEFYGGKCVQTIKIKYLPNSKVVLSVQEP